MSSQALVKIVDYTVVTIPLESQINETKNILGKRKLFTGTTDKFVIQDFKYDRKRIFEILRI